MELAPRPMKKLIVDGELGLVSEEVAPQLDRDGVELKPKAPWEHAQIVERQREVLRQLIL